MGQIWLVSFDYSETDTTTGEAESKCTTVLNSCTGKNSNVIVLHLFINSFPLTISDNKEVFNSINLMQCFSFLFLDCFPEC